jgi:hypothetical protein
MQNALHYLTEAEGRQLAAEIPRSTFRPGGGGAPLRPPFGRAGGAVLGDG